MSEKSFDILGAVLNIYDGNLDDHEANGWHTPDEAWAALDALKTKIAVLEDAAKYRLA